MQRLILYTIKTHIPSSREKKYCLNGFAVQVYIMMDKSDPLLKILADATKLFGAWLYIPTDVYNLNL